MLRVGICCALCFVRCVSSAPCWRWLFGAFCNNVFAVRWLAVLDVCCLLFGLLVYIVVWYVLFVVGRCLFLLVAVCCLLLGAAVCCLMCVECCL